MNTQLLHTHLQAFTDLYNNFCHQSINGTETGFLACINFIANAAFLCQSQLFMTLATHFWNQKMKHQQQTF